MKRVLGIDPGLQITGYGLVVAGDGESEPDLVEAGVIRLEASKSVEYRVAQLHDDLTGIIKALLPDCVVVETLYSHYRHPRTAILMAHARGVILLVAQQHHVRLEHLAATEVKKAVCGNGHASKDQVQRAIQTQYRLAEPPSPPDVADAIAIALTHARRLAGVTA